MINEALTLLQEAARSEPFQSAPALDQLGEILSKTSAHFALEEREMQQADYPDRASHKADHEKLLDELLDFIDDVEQNRDPSRLGDLEPRLEAWFTNHFGSFDVAFHRFVVDLK